jgi:hypothetical protein
MKHYFISVGIGLNMFFTEYFPQITELEKEVSWSSRLKFDHRFNNFVKLKSKEYANN